MSDNISPKILVSALVPAAGCGTRTGLTSNKVLAPLHGRPLLWWTIRALLHADALPPRCELAEILIAARPEEWSEIAEVLNELAGPGNFATSAQTKPLWRLVEGGKDRQSSVANAARAAQGSLLLVHDAARPLLAPSVVARVCAAALKEGAAIAALPCADTLKRADNSVSPSFPLIEATVDRHNLWLAQTPQVFKREILLDAIRYAEKSGFLGTDCASLIENNRDSDQPVALVEGDPLNFKVTYAADLERAARLLPLVDGFIATFDAPL